MVEGTRSGSEDFGRVLQARREALGLSRRDLVAASGLSYPYISQLETGYRLPSRKSVHMLAQALEMAPAELAAAIEFEPRPLSGAPVAASADLAAGSWQSNPAYRDAAAAVETRTARRRPGAHEVAAEAAELISALPIDQRLETLARVQQQVVDQLVEERSHRAGSGRR